METQKLIVRKEIVRDSTILFTFTFIVTAINMYHGASMLAEYTKDVAYDRARRYPQVKNVTIEWGPVMENSTCTFGFTQDIPGIFECSYPVEKNCTRTSVNTCKSYNYYCPIPDTAVFFQGSRYICTFRPKKTAETRDLAFGIIFIFLSTCLFILVITKTIFLRVRENSQKPNPV